MDDNLFLAGDFGGDAQAMICAYAMRRLYPVMKICVQVCCICMFVWMYACSISVGVECVCVCVCVWETVTQDEDMCAGVLHMHVCMDVCV